MTDQVLVCSSAETWLLHLHGCASCADLRVICQATAEQARVSESKGDVSDGHAQSYAALPLLSRMPQPQQAHVG